MKILLVGPTNKKDPNGNDLLEAYEKIIKASTQEISDKIEVSSTLLDEILIDVTTDELKVYDSRNHRDVSDFDLLLFRGGGIGRLIDVMGAITLYAQQHGIKMINEYSVVRDPSKLLQNVHFHFSGLKIPRTLYVNRGLFEHTDWARWEFPSVMKLTNGSLGQENFIVKNWDEVHEIYNRNLANRFILQEFIPNDGDYRLLLAGKRVLAFKRTSSGDSHLNNTSSGGTAKLVDLSEIPEAVIEQSHRISRQYGMTISGVDVMQSNKTGEFYFLEVNIQPQLNTGALLDEKQALIGELLKDLANEG